VQHLGIEDLVGKHRTVSHRTVLTEGEWTCPAPLRRPLPEPHVRKRVCRLQRTSLSSWRMDAQVVLALVRGLTLSMASRMNR
jgi:hypothetical protein